MNHTVMLSRICGQVQLKHFYSQISVGWRCTYGRKMFECVRPCVGVVTVRHLSKQNTQTAVLNNDAKQYEQHFIDNKMDPTKYKLIYRYNLSLHRYTKGAHMVVMQLITATVASCSCHVLYTHWDIAKELTFRTLELSPSHIEIMIASVSLSTFMPLLFLAMCLEIRKSILYIYKRTFTKEKLTQYIAIKSHWLFWTKQLHFTEKDIRFIDNWNESLVKLYFGNVAVKGSKYRLFVQDFEVMQYYNDFMGFKNQPLIKEKVNKTRKNRN